MNLLTIAFQAFFQPQDLQNYLSQCSNARKLLLRLSHLILLPSGYLLMYFFLTMRGFSGGNIFFAISVIAFFVVIALIIGFSDDPRFFKRDGPFLKRGGTLTLVVCTYWSILTNLLCLVAGYCNKFSFFMELEDILGTSIIIIAPIIIAPIIFFALMSTLYGKTSGIKRAFLFAFFVFLALLWINFSTIRDSPDYIFYIGLGCLAGTLYICIGLYRIPIYLFEIFFQVLSLISLLVNPKGVSKVIRMSPPFFDHVSTLPLPFTKTLLRLIASKDQRLCADQVVYLLKRTHHQKVLITFFYEFHRKYRDFLFEYLYKDFQTDDRQILTLLVEILKINSFNVSAEHKEGTPLKELIHFYSSLLRPSSLIYIAPVQKRIERHVDTLKNFSDSNYRFAREIYLTYSIFYRFLGFQNLQEIAQSNQFLAEILNINHEELLNAQVIDTFKMIPQMSNDLKNYEMVKNSQDKQYFLNEAKNKLNDASRKITKLHDPEKAILSEITMRWQKIISSEIKRLYKPAELVLSLLSKNLTDIQDWNPVSVAIKNVGQSPAENVRISLLENENMRVLDEQKVFGVLGTDEMKQVEFFVRPQGNSDELRMYFETVFDDFERKDKIRPFADIVVLSADSREFEGFENPFVTGPPLRSESEKVFFGRRGAQNFAIENLKGGKQNNVLIYFGQRRIGKSSILYRLMETPLKEEYVFVYIDCQGFGDVDTATLLYQICDKIYSAAKRHQIVIERPNLKQFKEHAFVELDEYLDTVEAALEQRHLALMFDEYELLEDKVKNGSVSPEIFNKLRNLMQHRSKLAFIFAGTHRLTELTEDYWSILFNIALYREIGVLHQDAAKALITEPVKGYLRYDELAIDKILRVTGLHPYFIQIIGRLLVNYCNKQQVNFVTLATVNHILKEAVEGSTAHVKYLFKSYSTKPEQEIMTFLCRVTDESKNFASVTEVEHFARENNFNYDREQVMEVFSSLKSKKLVKEIGEIRGEMYSFEIELLRIWIEDHVTIQQGFIHLV